MKLMGVRSAPAIASGVELLEAPGLMFPANVALPDIILVDAGPANPHLLCVDIGPPDGPAMMRARQP